MSFWVFENTKHCYSKIHSDGCHACGSLKASNTGRWKGPFDTYSQAVTSIKRKKGVTDDCKICNPQKQR